MQAQIEKIGNGVWQVRFGKPEAFTPNRFREKQPSLFDWERLEQEATDR